MAQSVRAGPKARLSVEQLRHLESELLRGPLAHGYRTDLWTLERMAYLIKQFFGVSYHPGHVYKILRGLGWSCQKPERRAKERDQAAIQRWLQKDWPPIKKGP